MVSRFPALNNDPTIGKKTGKQTRTRRPAICSFKGRAAARRQIKELVDGFAY
jgi:hypothetical protein